MRKKHFLALLAAIALACGLVGCQADTDTGQGDVSAGQEQTSAVSNNTIIPKVDDEETKPETTTAPQDDEINIETLADGEERDYNIEDILKNDLEIDGIPISIPCTLNELLETLGDDYSVDYSQIESRFEGEKDTKSKYFTGEYLSVRLYYKGENTFCQLRSIANPEKIDYDTINIIGFYSGSRYGVVSLSDLHVGDDKDKCIKEYGSPNKAHAKDNGTIYLTYVHNDCVMQLWISDNTIEKIFMIGYRTEDL